MCTLRCSMPSNLMEQSMTVASSSQELGNGSQQSNNTGSTSGSTPLVPVPASLPSDISIWSRVVDIKLSPSSSIPYDDQTISPVVAAPPAASSSADGMSSVIMIIEHPWRSCYSRPITTATHQRTKPAPLSRRALDASTAARQLSQANLL